MTVEELLYWPARDHRLVHVGDLYQGNRSNEHNSCSIVSKSSSTVAIHNGARVLRRFAGAERL